MAAPPPTQAPSTSSSQSGQQPTTTATSPGSSTTTTTPSTTASTVASSGCANPWANLEGCGWPGPGNTGPRLGNCPNGLTADSGSTTREITVSTDGAVISCQRITGALIITGRNVIIRDSVVSHDGGGDGGSGVIVVDNGGSATIERVETDGLNRTHACVWHEGSAVTVDGLNCHGVNDGVFAWADTGYASTSGDNFTVRNSYLHDFTTHAANGHIDGFQTEGAANGLIAGNTFLMPADATSAIAIWNGLKSATNITVRANLITGGGFSIYAQDYHPSEQSPRRGVHGHQHHVH